MSAKIDKSREKWQRSLKASRSERIKVLIERHYIQSESDLPAGVISARPCLQNSKSGSRWAYTRVYYEDKTFVCADCSKQVRWSAEDQAWAYEVVGIPAISDLKRCTPCRIAFQKKRDEDVKRMHAARDQRRSKQVPR